MAPETKKHFKNSVQIFGEKKKTQVSPTHRQVIVDDVRHVQFWKS